MAPNREEPGLKGIRVAVIGAGPQGLFTAGELVRRGALVTIFRAGPLTHPTEIGVASAAIGLIEPVAMAAEDAELVQQLCNKSMPSWLTADPRLGVDRRTVRFRPSSAGVPSWVPEMPYARLESETEWVFGSAVVTPQIWLIQAIRRLVKSGVQMRRQHITDLHSLLRDFPVVVNASGPGAWALGDREMFGSRAVIVWSNSQVSDVRFDDERFLYGIPQRRWVGFGGTAVPAYGDPRDWNREPRAAEVTRILDGAHDLYPELRKIEVLRVTCDYRPCRSRIRIEVEDLGYGLILHLVGFGGSGWTLAPGASQLGIQKLESAIAERQHRLTA